jgi:ATP-dependent RNA helicase DDX3X
MDTKKYFTETQSEKRQYNNNYYGYASQNLVNNDNSGNNTKQSKNDESLPNEFKSKVTFRSGFQTSNNNDNSYNKYSGNSSSNYKNNQSNNNGSNNKDWAYRYGRNGIIRNNVIQEDEELYKEHVEQMTKKKSFENEEFQKDCLVSFKGEDVSEKAKFSLFKEIELNKQLQINLEKMQFSLMTPIQRAVISYILQGNDVMGCAQTGSGKTIAFLLPIVSKMITQGPPPETSGYKKPSSSPVALILVPTRELAEQIYKEARKTISMTGINVVKVYGGVPHDSQIRELKQGCDILVATPGRLLDFIESGLISLKLVQNLIIDEADRILDMGFEPQLNRIVFESELPDKGQRQNLLFSATFSDDIKLLAKKFMNEYYFISTYKDSNTNANIKHVMLYSNDDQKYYKLHMILQQIQGSVIIFLDTKKGVDHLSNFLNDANYNTIAIHGDKTQIKRLEAIDRFKNGEIPILIATDVASRGLDFPSVSYVINFELPTNIEDYVHRIGRTGRVGNQGVAISIINEGNKPILRDLYLLLKKQNQEIPPWFEEMYMNVKDYKPSSSYYSNNNSYNKTSSYNKFNNKDKSESKTSYKSDSGYPKSENSYSKSDRHDTKSSYSNNNRKEKSPYKSEKYGGKQEKSGGDDSGMKKPIFFNNNKDGN